MIGNNMTDKQQTAMKQTLIKITDDHYVIVNDSEIKEGDIFIHPNNVIERASRDLDGRGISKIIASTNKINGVIFLNLSEVKELIGEVDVEKKAVEIYPIIMRTMTKIGGTYDTDVNFSDRYSYKKGYNQALEDNKDKKYTEEDMRAIFMHGYLLGVDRCNYSKDMEDAAIHYYFQPQIQWEVTFDEQDKLRLV